MTRSDLEQIYYLNRELKMWERELERLQKQSLVRSPAPNAVRGSGVADKVADRGNKVTDLEAEIRAKKEEIQNARGQAMMFIADIPNSLTRQIIHCRCVKLMSWRRVAAEVGGDNTEESVKKIYYRFFEKNKSCPECPD